VQARRSAPEIRQFGLGQGEIGELLERGVAAQGE
jgi:hypothetical protein